MLRDCHVAIPFAVVHNFSYLPYNNKKDIRIYFMAPYCSNRNTNCYCQNGNYRPQTRQENERQLHREVGEYFKNKNIDVLITVGELSKNIAAGVRTVSACDVHSYNTKDELEKDFTKLLKKGDNILVKASHGMQFTKIVDSLEKLEL